MKIGTTLFECVGINDHEDAINPNTAPCSYMVRPNTKRIFEEEQK